MFIAALFIHNSQKLGATQMSTNRTGKQIVVFHLKVQYTTIKGNELLIHSTSWT